MNGLSSFKYRRALLSFMAVLLVFLVITDVIIVSSQRKHLLNKTQKHMRTELDLAGSFVLEPLLSHDYAKVEQFLIRWGEGNDEIVEIKAIMPDNFILAKYNRKTPSSHSYNLQQKVQYAGKDLIVLKVVRDLSPEENILSRLRLQLIMGSIFAISILGTVLWFNQKKMALKPLEQEINMRRNAEDMLQKARDQLEVRVMERTTELKEMNKDLLLEIEEHKQAEKALQRSRQMFATVLDSIDAIVYVADMETYEVLYVNKYMRNIFGESEGGICWQKIQTGQSAPCSFCTNDKLLTPEGKPADVYHWEFRNTVNGNWYDIRDKAVEWVDGRIARVEIAMDITNRKWTEEREASFGRILDTSLNEIYIFDAETLKFIKVNRGAQENLGYSMEELCNLTPLDLKPEVAPEAFSEHIEPLRTGKRNKIQFTTVHCRKNGSLYPVEVHLQLSTYEGSPVFIAIIMDITEREQAGRALRLSEEKFSKAFRSSPTFITISTLKEGRFIDINDSFLNRVGYNREDVISHTELELGIWNDPADRDKLVSQLGEHGDIQNQESRLCVKKGEIFTVLYSAELIEIEGETCILAVILDITERKKLESQLLHAQKMEAVGQLAGGIAHDFNNILTAIISNCYILNKMVEKDDSSKDIVGKILLLSNNAAKITRELLIFSRKHSFQPLMVNLNDVIRGTERLLGNFIGDDVELRLNYTNKDLPIVADQNQIEQIIMNLATNARDAMPQGGNITIMTELVEINGDFMNNFGLGAPGTYALITFSDTGMGMDKKKIQKIFEPFFTTKEVGKGTGLGLSIVYGIVTQHKGYVNVYSEMGKGSSFQLFFPIINQKMNEKS